ncbi:MAG TPA: ATP-binding cassette domain-containing protein [Longimicrobiales bacterium]
MPESEDIIVVEDLTRTFGDVVAVDHVSFRVHAGEILAFLGPNGAGKSTTIKMLTTLLRPTSGHMLVAGHDPTRDPNAVRRAFGIVFQDPSLDGELTAYENLDFHGVLYHVPRATRRERIPDLLRFVGLWDRRGDQVKQFSGGMKRRLEIARGLLHHPRILYLDEPTLGLDPQTRNQLWEHVRELNRTEGITVFFTTHYIEEAEKVAQRVIIIDHGKVKAVGTPEELKAQAGAPTLEEAFLEFTGRTIREEEATGVDRMRMQARMWKAR